jgi:acetyl esterase/lipase
MLLKKILPIAIIAQTLFSAANAQNSVIYLWNEGAPGFEIKKNDPELSGDWWIRNINNPSLTIFRPSAANANGCAIILCPGGGFQNIVYNSEGRDPAKFLNNLGFTVFVLKYRLFRMDHSPYTEENVKQDIFRAMRLVKSRAIEFEVDTAKIGVMGFSAGGEVSGWISYHWQEEHFVHPDLIDSFCAKPAFQILIYPGPLCVPDSVSPTAPPTFLLAANGDDCCSEPLVKLVQMHRKAKVPVEMHLYEKGAHAFNMGYRSEYISLKHWPDRLTDWLTDNGWCRN